MVKGLIERMPGVLGGGAAAEVLDAAAKSDVLAIGPGLGTSEATGEVILNILENYEGTAVIDARRADGVKPQSRNSAAA